MFKVVPKSGIEYRYKLAFDVVMYTQLIIFILGLLIPILSGSWLLGVIILGVVSIFAIRYRETRRCLRAFSAAIWVSVIQLYSVDGEEPKVSLGSKDHTVQVRGFVVDRIGGSGAVLSIEQKKYYLPQGIKHLGCRIQTSGYARPTKHKKSSQKSQDIGQGGFDEYRWLARHGIYRVWQASSVEVLSCKLSWVQTIWQGVREYLMYLPITHHREIQSLLIGFSAPKPDYWYELGLIHLLTISGLHIRMIVNIVAKISAFTRLVVSQRRQVMIGLLVTYGYLMVLGFSIPAFRAWLFILLQQLGQVLRLKWSRFQYFWVVVAIILVLDPLAVYDVGFWFSHIATLMLLCISALTSEERYDIPKSDSISVFLALSMLSIYQHQPINLVSVLANMLIAEYFIKLLLPTLAIGGVGLGIGLILSLDLPYVRDLLIYLDWMFAQIDTTIDWVKFLFKWHLFLTKDRILSVLTVCVLRYLFRAPWVVMSLLLISMPGEVIPKGRFYVHMFDVGHGLSVFIQTKKHQLLYDIGSQGMKDVAAKRVLPFLYRHHVNFLDALVVSHPDADHSNGVNQLLDNIYVHKIWVGVPIEISSPYYIFNRPPQTLCQRGQKWVWDGVMFEFLHPDQADVWQGNNQSCVLKVTGSDNQILLTGDIEKVAEKSLLMNQKALSLRSTYLLLPHHGSLTSATPDFMAAVLPSTLLVSESKHKLHERWQFDDRVYQPPFSRTL
ncbi:MAG: DNA internalization-related competence protein ComEC/Rec2 [Pseudomonadota bacterium]|nr:DNA internalization-related competence protein ComEC/Rec2 [Pseudomonadota bacterium]